MIQFFKNFYFILELVNEQKNIVQFIDSFTKPKSSQWNDANDGAEITRKTVPRLPKISTKQIIGVVRGSTGNLAVRSAHDNNVKNIPNDMQILRSFSLNRQTRPDSRQQDGFCYYYNKKPIRRNV